MYTRCKQYHDVDIINDFVAMAIVGHRKGAHEVASITLVWA